MFKEIKYKILIMSPDSNRVYKCVKTKSIHQATKNTIKKYNKLLEQNKKVKIYSKKIKIILLEFNEGNGNTIYFKDNLNRNVNISYGENWKIIQHDDWKVQSKFKCFSDNKFRRLPELIEYYEGYIVYQDKNKLYFESDNDIDGVITACESKASELVSHLPNVFLGKLKSKRLRERLRSELVEKYDLNYRTLKNSKTK